MEVAPQDNLWAMQVQNPTLLSPEAESYVDERCKSQLVGGHASGSNSLPATQLPCCTAFNLPCGIFQAQQTGIACRLQLAEL